MTKNLISIINNEIHKMKTLNENYNLLHENITCFFLKKKQYTRLQVEMKTTNENLGSHIIY